MSLKDLEELEKPDTILQRKMLSATGNPSKCFMQLELGLLPVKDVIIQKRMNFLYYILHENKNSMIHQVYVALKEDSRSGDFKALTDKDRKDLDIKYSDKDIEVFGKVAWKKYIKEKSDCSSTKFSCCRK